MKKLLYASLVAVGVLAVACGDSDNDKGDETKAKTCNSSKECDTGYCSPEHYCAPKPAGMGTWTEGKPEGANCTKSEECADSLLCHDSQCKKANDIRGTECESGTATQCLGNNMLSCMYDGNAYRYNLETCKEDEVCASNKNVVSCATACTKAEAESKATTTRCDPENTDDDGYVIGVIILQCTERNGSYYYVPTGEWRNCGNGSFCGWDKNNPNSCD